MTEQTTKRRVRKTGTVKSAKMDKTLVVSVERRVKHPRYKKYLKRYSTFCVHDENNEAREGDVVEIEFTRPISKTKRWKLLRVLGDSGGSA